MAFRANEQASLDAWKMFVLFFWQPCPACSLIYTPFFQQRWNLTLKVKRRIIQLRRREEEHDVWQPWTGILINYPSKRTNKDLKLCSKERTEKKWGGAINFLGYAHNHICRRKQNANLFPSNMPDRQLQNQKGMLLDLQTRGFLILSGCYIIGRW